MIVIIKMLLIDGTYLKGWKGITKFGFIGTDVQQCPPPRYTVPVLLVKLWTSQIWHRWSVDKYIKLFHLTLWFYSRPNPKSYNESAIISQITVIMCKPWTRNRVHKLEAMNVVRAIESSCYWCETSKSIALNFAWNYVKLTFL